MLELDRRGFLRSGAIGAAGLIGSRLAYARTSGAAAIDLEEATVASLRSAMTSGEATSRAITEGYLARIADIDKKLNSVIELNPDALAVADQMDRERASGRVRGPLHGIPVLIKDNIDTADKMKTTAGSLALVDAPAPRQDAFIVRRLREAGAVLLGKTNLSEWANFRSTRSTSGWSGRGGQTRNPYILDRNPCGSSSGSGVAASANLAALTVGTETDGSIVCPSSINGIVGIKPTLGLVSRSGIIPIAHSQDTAGPMCRTVADAAALLTVLAGADPDDAITTAATKEKKDYTQFLAAGGLRGAKIGVARQFFGRNEKLDKLLEAQLQVLKDGGAALTDIELPKLREIDGPEFEVLLYEFKEDLNKYLAARGGQYRTLKDLIDFNNKNAAREMPHFGQEIFIQAEGKGDLNDRAYRIALMQSKLFSQEQGIDGVMTKHGIDAIFAPSNSPVWPIDLINGDCFGNYISSSTPAAVAGYPNVTVPAGHIDELPIGVSFFGRAFSEPVLIKIAFAFEQAVKARRVPKLLASFPV